MGMEEIEVVIDKDGKVHIDVKGVTGASCTEITKPLEEALGDVEERTFTPEYHAEEALDQGIQQQD